MSELFTSKGATPYQYQMINGKKRILLTEDLLAHVPARLHQAIKAIDATIEGGMGWGIWVNVSQGHDVQYLPTMYDRDSLIAIRLNLKSASIHLQQMYANFVVDTKGQPTYGQIKNFIADRNLVKGGYMGYSDNPIWYYTND